MIANAKVRTVLACWGITQRDLAKVYGCSTANLSQTLSRDEITPEARDRLAAAMAKLCTPDRVV